MLGADKPKEDCPTPRTLRRRIFEGEGVKDYLYGAEDEGVEAYQQQHGQNEESEEKLYIRKKKAQSVRGKNSRPDSEATPYDPEEALKKRGGTFNGSNAKSLLYDEVPSDPDTPRNSRPSPRRKEPEEKLKTMKKTTQSCRGRKVRQDYEDSAYDPEEAFKKRSDTFNGTNAKSLLYGWAQPEKNTPQHTRPSPQRQGNRVKTAYPSKSYSQNEQSEDEDYPEEGGEVLDERFIELMQMYRTKGLRGKDLRRVIHENEITDEEEVPHREISNRKKSLRSKMPENSDHKNIPPELVDQMRSVLLSCFGSKAVNSLLCDMEEPSSLDHRSASRQELIENRKRNNPKYGAGEDSSSDNMRARRSACFKANSMRNLMDGNKADEPRVRKTVSQKELLRNRKVYLPRHTATEDDFYEDISEELAEQMRENRTACLSGTSMKKLMFDTEKTNSASARIVSRRQLIENRKLPKNQQTEHEDMSQNPKDKMLIYFNACTGGNSVKNIMYHNKRSQQPNASRTGNHKDISGNGRDYVDSNSTEEEEEDVYDDMSQKTRQQQSSSKKFVARKEHQNGKPRNSTPCYPPVVPEEESEDGTDKDQNEECAGKEINYVVAGNQYIPVETAGPMKDRWYKASREKEFRKNRYNGNGGDCTKNLIYGGGSSFPQVSDHRPMSRNVSRGGNKRESTCGNERQQSSSRKFATREEHQTRKPRKSVPCYPPVVSEEDSEDESGQDQNEEYSDKEINYVMSGNQYIPIETSGPMKDRWHKASREKEFRKNRYNGNGGDTAKNLMYGRGSSAPRGKPQRLSPRFRHTVQMESNSNFDGRQFMEDNGFYEFNQSLRAKRDAIPKRAMGKSNRTHTTTRKPTMDLETTSSAYGKHAYDAPTVDSEEEEMSFANRGDWNRPNNNEFYEFIQRQANRGALPKRTMNKSSRSNTTARRPIIELETTSSAYGKPVYDAVSAVRDVDPEEEQDSWNPQNSFLEFEMANEENRSRKKQGRQSRTLPPWR